jgi:hypothetical protein
LQALGSRRKEATVLQLIPAADLLHADLKEQLAVQLFLL